MPENFTIVNKGNNGRASMMLTGWISPYNGDQSFSASKFIEQFNNLKEANSEIHIDIVNLYGGSIIEGIPIYNHIKDTAAEGKVKITGKIDGMAASMGSIIAMAIPVQELEMGNMARLMNHRARGGAYGTGEEVKNTGENILSFEDDLVTILAERTGWAEAKVREKWLDGNDHYIKSEEALKYKLVGKTTKSKAIKKEPKNVSSPMEVFNFYQEQITNSIQNASPEGGQNTSDDMKLIAQFIAAFAIAGIELTGEPDEKAILDEVNNLAKNNKKLKNELETATNDLKDFKEAAVTNFVNDCKDRGLIKESQVNSLTKMATNSMEDAREFVNGLQPHKSLGKQLNQGQDGGAQNSDDEKSFDWYRKNNPNALAKMRKDDPDKYNALYQARNQEA